MSKNEQRSIAADSSLEMHPLWDQVNIHFRRLQFICSNEHKIYTIRISIDNLLSQ